MRKLLIVGAGMATSRLLTEVARHEHDFAIEVIGEEPHACYNRILLSSLLAGEKTLAQTSLIDSNWYRRHGVSLHTGEKVIELDRNNREVITDQGRRRDYDVLVLATGSRPFIPPIPGTDYANVLGFRNLEDLARIRALAGEGRRAVIIGGGLLGLEAAYGMTRLGLHCSVINREDWLMPRQLSKAAAGVLQTALQEQGMTFHLGVTPQAITGASQAELVHLDNNHHIECDLVLITAGIQANTTLASASGLQCDRGISVDSRLRTSAEAIYALGECAQIGTESFGLVAPVYQQAAILAANLCLGGDREYSSMPNRTQLKISGIDVVSAGRLDLAAPQGFSEQVVCHPGSGVYRRLLFQQGSLIGFELIGDKRHSARYAELLEEGAATECQASQIMFQPDAGRDSLPAARAIGVN